jgi:hypothetical protein
MSPKYYSYGFRCSRCAVDKISGLPICRVFSDFSKEFVTSLFQSNQSMKNRLLFKIQVTFFKSRETPSIFYLPEDSNSK